MSSTDFVLDFGPRDDHDLITASPGRPQKGNTPGRLRFLPLMRAVNLLISSTSVSHLSMLTKLAGGRSQDHHQDFRS